MNPNLRLEIWLAKRVSSPNLQTVFEGVTDLDGRRERIRQRITQTGIADAPAGGVKRGRPKTFRECFEQVYGVPL